MTSSKQEKGGQSFPRPGNATVAFALVFLSPGPPWREAAAMERPTWK